MAFQSVDVKNKYVKLSELKVGSSISGYMLGFEASTKNDGTNMVMKIDGERVIIGAIGNIKYAVKDNKIKIGLNTRFTRLEDTKVKGKTATRFSIEQDPDDATTEVSVGQLMAAATAPSASMAEKIKSLKG